MSSLLKSHGCLEGMVYRAIAYFSARFQRDQRLFRSIGIRGHVLRLSQSFPLKKYGPWKKLTKWLKVILDGNFKGATDSS